LKIDFGDKQFNREQLELELANRFNKIELKRIDDEVEDSINQEESKDDSLMLDPVMIMENNLQNISAIQPHFL
jgi:hypothetical protein